MEYRQPDMQEAAEGELARLHTLPRPVFGQVSALPNRAIARMHRHPWGQLSYAGRGVVAVSTADAYFVAPPSYAVWIPPGTPHGVRCETGTALRSLYIEPAALPCARAHCAVLAVTPLLRELICAFSEGPVEYDQQGAQGRLVQVLLDQLIAAPAAALSLPWPQDARLQKLCRHLQSHPEAPIGLREFGARLHLSERSLSRLFLQQTGLSFRLWRQRLRLLSALPLLERGDRVTDVALACGYNSMSAFIATFRAQFGRTPGEFAR